MSLPSYSRPQIALHWAVAALFLVNYVVSDDLGRALRTIAQGGTPEGLTPMVHVWGGIAVLVLTLLRIGLRIARRAPAAVGRTLSERVAHWGHIALYALLLALTGSGVAAWFGGVREAGEAHEVLVNLTLLLVAAHTLAALFHQYVLKDGLLARMTRTG